jgi:NADH-quinone oxidoreductase subunit N
MTFFMVSLAGVPPAAGFWAKILIFGAAIARGDVIGPLLAAIMVVNSVISVFYYLAVARQMIFQPAQDTTPIRTPGLVAGVVGLSMTALLFFFLLPGTFSRLADISTLVA